MKKKLALFASIAASSAMLLTACPAQTAEDYRVPEDSEYLPGKAAKRVYNAYMGQAPKNFDARSSQTGDIVAHLANFEDCLLMNDEYGILKKSLAATAHRNSDDTKFWFTIRKDPPWVTCNNTIYVDPATKQEQYVKAEDFVTTAKEILNYSNRSEIYYMYTLFIKNAWEYYCYTMMSEYIAGKKVVDGFNYGDKAFYESDDAQAEQLTKLVKKYSNSAPDTPITGADLEDIASFSRIGVSVDGGVLTYELNQQAPFFPTMLTYTPYTPMNKAFIKEQQDQYGKKRENILYCGAYICKDQSSSGLKYEKNQHYWNKNKVHIDQVNYIVANANLGYADQRKAYLDGTVDGFSLNVKDDVGWKEYITGYDNDNPGDIQHPVSELVNSRELDDVDYTYHFMVNANRSTEDVSFADSNFYKTEFGMSQSASEEVKNKIRNDIKNTNKALQLTEVRKLILNGIDLAEYNKYYYAAERDQYQMNTFTPRGYVYDGAGVDYVDYYYAYFAEQKGLVDEDAAFDEKVEAGKEVVGPQQIAGVNLTNDEEITDKYPWLSADDQVANANRSLELYNQEHPEDKITFPINIEFLGTGALDDDSAAREETATNLWNERANGCAISEERSSATGLPLCSSTDSKGKVTYPKYYLRLSNAKDMDSLTNQAENGYYTFYTGWGWMGDYADPLTYVHCFVTNGEMSKMSGCTSDQLMTYDYDSVSDSLDGHLLYGGDEGYNQAVIKANEERDSLTKRYQKFAEVEYKLLNEVYVIRPVAMHTQGWVASVSRAAGYENPQAHYGLADHMLIGMWVLVEPPTGTERDEARKHHKEREAEALAAVGGNAINGAFVD